jgi:hypothetical protein
MGRDRRWTYLAERFPRLDSSKMHSWLPVRQRLQGGPFSASTHFILRRRHTVQALTRERKSLSYHMHFAAKERRQRITNLDPRVGFGFSSLSAEGLWPSPSSSSIRTFFRLVLAVPFEMDEAGRLLRPDAGYICSTGGVPIVSEAPDDGEE